MPYSVEEMFTHIKNKLEEHGCSPKMHGGYTIRSSCPAHGGKSKSSLHTQLKGGKVVMYCHSGGCCYQDVLNALEVHLGDALDTEFANEVRYVYHDQNGKTVSAQTRKYGYEGEKIFFRETVIDGKFEPVGPPPEDRVPYRLPELIAAAKEGERIWIVEGEKDVEQLYMYGVKGTAFMGAAEGWVPSYAKWFRGTSVVICGDRDEPGQKFVKAVKDGLAGEAQEILLADLPYKITKSHGKDVSDYLFENSVEDLMSLVNAPWRAPGVITLAEAANEASELQKIPMEHFSMVGMGPGYDIPGIGPGKFMGILARLGSGKTAWIVDLCVRAIQSGKRVMFISYDEPAPSIASYLATSFTGDFTYCSYDMELDHERKAPNTCKEIMNSNGIIDGKVKGIDIVADIAFQHKPDIVFVDHLAKIASDNMTDKEYVKLGKIAKVLREIANNGKCSVVAAIQSNREASDSLLTTYNTAGSDEICREMDVVLGIQLAKPPGSEARVLDAEKLLKPYGWGLNELFPKPDEGFADRIRPAMRIINTVKSRMSKGDGVWPVVFYGAERRFFPVHRGDCECKMCDKRHITNAVHNMVVKMARGTNDY